MFELPSTPESLLVAIPTFVVAEDLFTFIEDEVDRVERIPLLHSGETINIPSAIHQASLVDKITLQNLADRFDCEAMGACLRDSLQFYYDSLTGIKLLAAASKVESITVARVAIIKMGKDRKWENKASYHRWWKELEHIRPSWQIALTKVVWEFQNELVNSYQEPRRHKNGRRFSRTRETIMVQTRMSPEAIAAAFDPPKVSITTVRIDQADEQDT
jgi:hypothetical protein